MLLLYYPEIDQSSSRLAVLRHTPRKIFNSLESTPIPECRLGRGGIGYELVFAALAADLVLVVAVVAFMGLAADVVLAALLVVLAVLTVAALVVETAGLTALAGALEVVLLVVLVGALSFLAQPARQRTAPVRTSAPRRTGKEVT